MNQPLLLFDGVCNLCNGAVQFVLKRDKEKKFHFTSLQSSCGQKFLTQHGLPADKFNSLVLYQDDKVYTHSTAALKLFTQLKGWKWMKVFFVVPKFIRDGVYNLIARNRYRWFGKKDECMIPTPELKERFIE